MKKLWIVTTSVALAFALLASCSGDNNTPASTVPASTAPASESTAASTAGAGESDVSLSATSGETTFTLEELATYDGKDGRPAYVAVDSVVYDVTDVPAWANGEHKNGLTAGNDLTEAIKEQSPHGTSVLANLPVVGKLAAE